MPDDPVVMHPGEDGVRGEHGPIVRDDHAGLPRRLINAVSSRATRRPEIEVSRGSPPGTPESRHRRRSGCEIVGRGHGSTAVLGWFRPAEFRD
jgi:hypothetical protein